MGSTAELSPLERMEAEDRLVSAKRKLKRDPWIMLGALAVAAAVQYPILGFGMALATSISILTALFVFVEARDRRRTKALIADLTGLLESGSSDP